MKNLILTILVLLPVIAISQIEWKEINSPNEILTGVIHAKDTSATDKQLYDAISAALPILQANRINNKTTNKQQITTAIVGGNTTSGNAQQTFSGFQTQTEPSLIVFNVQDIQKNTRIYYTAKIQIKPGRYKITITPVGTSGTALMAPQITWGNAYKKTGEVKGLYKNYVVRWRGFMDQFVKDLEAAVNEGGGEEDDW